MKKVTKKLLIISIILIMMLGTPSLVLFFQRGMEQHFIPKGPIKVDSPLGVANAGVTKSNQTRLVSKDLGINWVRMDAQWKGVQNATGFYDFTYADWKIGNLSAMNISILFKLDYDNNAVETDPIGNITDHHIAPSDVLKWLDFVNQTISRYYPTITHFEIWNEPNSQRFWEGPWSDFFYLFQETVKFIKTNFPGVFLIAPAIAVMGHSFLNQLFQEGYLQQCDAISFHIYQQYNEALIYSIYQLQDLCDLYDYEGEFWVTETGFPTGGTYIHVIDERDQGDRLIKSITLTLALGIAQSFWYTFDDDEIDNSLDSENYFGLLFSDLSYKTGAHAFKFFNDYCSNSTLRTDLVTLSGFPARKNLFAFLYQRENLVSTLVVWYTSSLVSNEKIRINLDLPAIPGTVQSHSFVDNSSQLFTQKSMRLGYTALILTFTAIDSATTVIIRANPSKLAFFAYFLMGIGICTPITMWILRKSRPQILEKIKEK